MKHINMIMTQTRTSKTWEHPSFSSALLVPYQASYQRNSGRKSFKAKCFSSLCCITFSLCLCFVVIKRCVKSLNYFWVDPSPRCTYTCDVKGCDFVRFEIPTGRTCSNICNKSELEVYSKFKAFSTIWSRGHQRKLRARPTSWFTLLHTVNRAVDCNKTLNSLITIKYLKAKCNISRNYANFLIEKHLFIIDLLK